MKFKKLITKKKFWITVLIGTLVTATVLILVLRNRNFNSPENGNAAFYEYSASATDSILNLMKSEERALTLIFNSNMQDSSLNLCNAGSGLSGYFYLKLNNPEISGKYSKIKDSNRFIKAINENLLTGFSNDSIMYVAPQLLGTINDSTVLSRYYRYQTNLLIANNINALVSEIHLPESPDSTSVMLILNKLKTELEILHRNKILSFISFAEVPSNYKDQDKTNLKELISQLSEAGLCGIIASSPDMFNLINESGFDGIISYKLDKGMLPDKDIISKADAFICSNNDNSQIEELSGLIKKHNTGEDLFLKSSKVVRAGLWANTIPASNDSLSGTLNIKLLESNITEASITVLKNENSLIPLNDINQKIHIVFATKENPKEFINTISEYSTNYTISYFDLMSGKTPSVSSVAGTLIILYESESKDSVPEALQNCLSAFSKNKIFINFGEIPSGIMNLNANSIFQVYNVNNTGLSFSAQLIYGGIAAGGTLTTKVNDTVSYGYGIRTAKTRLKYSLPEDAGLNPEKLKDIDSIVNYAISTGAMPGCQVFVAKNGIVVYDKSFGYMDYSHTNAVDNSDMYDVASLTKICATTLAMMKMVETGKIKLDDKLEKYFKNTEIDYGKIKPDTVTIIDTINIKNKTLTEIDELVINKDTVYINDTMLQLKEVFITKTTPSSNIFQVPVRSLLVHQSGISPSLPVLPYMFYEKSYSDWKYEEEIKSGNPDAEKKTYPRQEAWDYYYSNKWIKDSAEVKIADNMYLQNRWRDTLYEDVKRLGTFNRSTYQYTDVNMILAQTIIDTVNKMSIDKFVKDEFYEDLGMKNSTFTPLNFNIPKNRIAPTENETFWRQQVIHGTVHDPSAAMLGGISGNAGLFSTASDLGILGQMWLNGGTYGGHRYLNPGTIKMFAATQPENHRGLGFDKAAIKNLNAPSAPASTYGHSGFTGCVMWIDPENEIVYVFLSNRLHPDVNNWKILGQKVLQNVHQVIYDAMEE